MNLDSPVETDGLLQISTFADFLVGQSAAQNGSPQGPSNVSTTIAGGGIFRRNERYTDFAGFAQDDIKVDAATDGECRAALRDLRRADGDQGPAGELRREPRDDGPFRRREPSVDLRCPRTFRAPSPAGVTKTAVSGLWKTPYGDVSPRLGFVWQMTKDPVIVLRGGYGIYYDQHSAGNLAEHDAAQPPYATLQIVSGAPNGPATLQQPFVPLVLPNSSYPIFTPRTPTSTPFIEGTGPEREGRQDAGVQPQRAVCAGTRLLLEVGYVGTQSSASVGAGGVRPGSPRQSAESGERRDDELDQQCRRPGCPIQGVSQGSLFTQSSSSRTTTRCRRASRGGCSMGSSFREAMCGRRTWTR